MTIDEYLAWVKNNQNAPTPTGNVSEPVSAKGVVDTSSVEKAGADVPTAPQTLEVVPLVLMCHYRNPEMTEISVKTLLETNPWVKKVLIVDTSEAQDAPKPDKRVQIISFKGSNHSQGVQKGLDWAKSKLYAGCKKGKDKWVLLLDSDVIFDHDVSGIIHESQKEGFVLTGHEQYLPGRTSGMVVLPRIHPAFCLMNLSWLVEKNIPFMDWNRIKPDNMGPLSNRPQDWKPVEAFKRGQKSIYDVGSTMYEDVKHNGGKIWNLGTIWELDHDRGTKSNTIYHVGSISWGNEKDEKMVWAKWKYSTICGFVNVLTRFHHGREEKFKELVESLKGQKVKFHVSIEEYEQRDFILSVVPEARVVKVEKGEGPGFFNGYINPLKEGIDGPVWVLDSDDVAFPDAVKTILMFYNEEQLTVFPVKWRDDSSLPKRNPDMISSQCLVWNPSKIAIDWSDKVYEADNVFFKECKENDPDSISFVTLDPGHYVAWLKTNNNGK